jgi:hypothetical protein
MPDGGPYDIGDEVTLEGTTTVNGVPTDATTATWRVRKPDLTQLSPAPSLLHPSVGIYQGKVQPDQAGDWWYGLDTTGTAKASEEKMFIVRPKRA